MEAQMGRKSNLSRPIDEPNTNAISAEAMFPAIADLYADCDQTPAILITYALCDP